MCFIITLKSFPPSATAASTYSNFRSFRNSPLMRRATPVQLVAPITIIMLYMLGSLNASMVSMRKNTGNVIITSKSRDTIKSVVPP